MNCFYSEICSKNLNVLFKTYKVKIEISVNKKHQTMTFIETKKLKIMKNGNILNG